MWFRIAASIFREYLAPVPHVCLPASCEALEALGYQHNDIDGWLGHYNLSLNGTLREKSRRLRDFLTGM
jgi:hypothetical protein